MHRYRLISKLGEGTSGQVVKAQNVLTNKFYALKTLNRSYISKEDAGSLREIKALRSFSEHPNIIKLFDVIFQRESGRVTLVLELLDMNLYETLKGRRHWLPELKIFRWVFQLLLALDFLHSNNTFHRDIKPENILLTNDIVKLADFGSCKSLTSRPPFTEYIATRWYRSPECLLTDGHYTYKLDLWALGCVVFEIVALSPLFPGDNEIDQLSRIHRVLGTRSRAELDSLMGQHCNRTRFPPEIGTGIRPLIPHASFGMLSLISGLVEYNPKKRISARTGIDMSIFNSIRTEFSSNMYVIVVFY